MAEPRTFTTDDFDYPLPEALIAQAPSAARGGSRMLVVRRAGGQAGGRAEAASSQAAGAPEAGRPPACPPLEDLHFPDLVSLIPPGDLLVRNTTRVRHARLLGFRPGGGAAEVLLIHPAADGSWLAMGKPGSALRPGKRIHFDQTTAVETLSVEPDGLRRVAFIGISAEEAMRKFGFLPLPPYITHQATPLDEERYQTVYARKEGSVAAPTAGLHFTDAILAALEAKGVAIGDLDLAVGPGTFKPVDVTDPAAHVMHEEAYEIPGRLAEQVKAVRARGGKVWAVGTTVVRALESAANDDGTITAGPASTSLFIHPGFRFRVVDRLQTNFHLPRSTLLMLVAAFAGYETTMAAYRHAVAARYRFYSYGDCMVIL